MPDPGLYGRIYTLCAAIPRGKVATYGQLALLCGHPRAARLVGQAMRHAPAGLPCHRVIRADGSMAPGDAFGGQGLQQKMLEDEGVVFLANGHVDLAISRWDGKIYSVPAD